jgi:hypothetical protein
MSKISTTVHVYGWVIKAIGAALLLALALTLYFVEVAVLIEAFVGVIIVIYALIRLIPYVKSQKNDLIKTINIIEITLNILVGALFLTVALTNEEGLGQVFGYLVGGVLLARGMVHFYGLSSGHEEGDHITYFFHIASIALGTLILYRGFNSEDLVILFIVLALIGTSYLSYDSFNGYNMYRKRKTMSKSDEVSKDDQDRPSKGYDVPTDEDKDRDEIIS